MCCLGRCHENHAFHYQGKNYSGPLNGSLEKILHTGSGSKDKYLVGAMGQSLLTGDRLSLEDSPAVIGKMLNTDRERLLEEIRQSGLRGRGGPAGALLPDRDAHVRRPERRP